MTLLTSNVSNVSRNYEVRPVTSPGRVPTSLTGCGQWKRRRVQIRTANGEYETNVWVATVSSSMSVSLNVICEFKGLTGLNRGSFSNTPYEQMNHY